MMSVATARAVARLLRSNAITVVNVMGGEFYLNPDWQEILDLIAAAADRVCLVSNGDWAAGGSVADRVVGWLQAHPHVHLSLSRDRWHTNGHVDRAAELCARLGISFNVAEPGQTTPDSIVQVGRGEMEAGFYAYVGTYCKNPEHRYAFLIDEQGEICRCPFGLLPFSDVFRHQDGGFAPVFRRFGEVFLRTFIPSCAVCARALVDRSFKADLYSESTASGDAE